jgi:hypothetical protein
MLSMTPFMKCVKTKPVMEKDLKVCTTDISKNNPTSRG